MGLRGVNGTVGSQQVSSVPRLSTSRGQLRTGYLLKPETEVLPKISFAGTPMVQGRSVKMRIIKQKKQRCKRKKRQKHRTAPGHSGNTESALLYVSLPKGGATDFINACYKE